MNFLFILMLAANMGGGAKGSAGDPSANGEGRRPSNDAELRDWLENMFWHHRFTDAEAAAATGLSLDELASAKDRLGVRIENRPTNFSTDHLRLLPYPGGRHPRIGFLDGAKRPQRETKFSVFLPWDADSYVVADIPEALFTHLGLTYLAHTHVPTIWDQQGVTLERLEWRREPAGAIRIERRLPNGLGFSVRARPEKDHVALELILSNNTPRPIREIRIQNCVMLKGARGFSEQTNANKQFRPPYSAVRSAQGNHWIVTAWWPCQRAWGNAPCPCLHSDVGWPACAANGTCRAVGGIWFATGDDFGAIVKRLDAIGWHKE